MKNLLFYTFCFVTLFFFAADIRVAHSLESANNPNVVIVKGLNISPYDETIEGLLQNLDLKPQIFEVNGDKKETYRILQKISEKKPDLIITLGNMSSIIAAKEVKEVPVFYLLVTKSMDFFEGNKNISGITLNPDPKDQFSLLERVYPLATRIGIIFNPRNSQTQVNQIKDAAPPGKSIVTVEIKSEKEVPEAIREVQKKSDILWMVMDEDIIKGQAFQYIVKFSVSNQYPILGFSKKSVQMGALFSSVTDYKSIGKQASGMVKQILKNGHIDSPHRFPSSTGMAYNERMGKLINKSFVQQNVNANPIP